MKTMIKQIMAAVIIGAVAFSSNIGYAIEALEPVTSTERFADRIEKKQEHLINIAQNREELKAAIANISTTNVATVSTEMFLERIAKKQEALVNMRSDREEFARMLAKPLDSDARFADRLAYKTAVVAAK